MLVARFKNVIQGSSIFIVSMLLGAAIYFIYSRVAASPFIDFVALNAMTSALVSDSLIFIEGVFK